MNEKEEIAIKKWHESLQEPIQLALILTESDQNQLFNDYAAAFTQIAPAVEIKKEKKDTADASVKGDVLYLLGIIGSPEIIHPLKSILSDSEDPDLKGALQEAISAIKSRKPIILNDKQ